MQPVLFDTSVYYAALRTKEGTALQWRQLAGGAPIWLSSVVLEELYAGADARSGRAVERMERDFERSRRVLVPESQGLGANREGTCPTRGQVRLRAGWEGAIDE